MEATAMDAAGDNPDAVLKETHQRVNRTLDKVDRFIGDGNSVSSAQAIATAPQPAAPWHVWVCVGAAWVATIFAAVAYQSSQSAAQRMTDLRIDMRAEQTNRQLMDNWGAQELTAIRSYITTGKLSPMKPRPDPSKEK